MFCNWNKINRKQQVRAKDFSPLLVLLLFFFATNIRAAGISVVKLSTDYQDGFVVVEQVPKLSWVLTSNENGTYQTAYEIEIREAVSQKKIWDSGKINSSQSHLVDIAASKLLNDNTGKTYQWRVKVWDEQGTPSAWSDYVRFLFAPEALTGKQWIGAITRAQAHLPEGRNFHGTELKKPEVKALWNAVDTLSRRSIYLRKEFDATKKIAEAVVYVCGLGNYELSFNGKKVGDGEFTPLWSDFDKSVYYNTYDVTSLLSKGKNAVGVLLGNGIYNEQGGRYTKLKISFGPPTLLFRLQITYQDGTRLYVDSDRSWKYSLSPITFNSLYGGEDYDARLEQKGWDTPRFNASKWQRVVMQQAPKGILRPQSTTPVKIMERYGVKTATKLTSEEIEKASVSTKRTVSSSAIVFDMGQNLAGFPEITVKGKAGQQVTLLVGESLTEEGAVNQKQTGRPYYYIYTLKGKGTETWHPRFSYYGFRYIQVEGVVREGDPNPNDLPVLKNLQSCFLYNSAAKVSTFETSNDLFNATHRLIEKAVRSNMQSVFTDCPQREKLGWMEQNHLNGPGLLFNYDLRSFSRKMMQDIADAQYTYGAIPNIAPQYVIFEGKGMDVFNESPEWGGTFIIFPFMYENAYGDDSLIRKYYEQMKAYLNYLTFRAEDHLLDFGLGDWYDYGDFRAGFSRNTPVSLVATSYYFMDLKYMAKAARMLGKTADAEQFEQLAKEVNKAFNDKFLDRATSEYGTGSQTSNALPLFAGMTTDDNGNPDSVLYRGVLANLVKDVKAHGDRLTTGDVGNRYLFQALAENNENGLLYKMFNHLDAPGYGFQLKFGATTLTEQWDPRQGSSWNHFMMGQIDEWFFKSVAGLHFTLPSSLAKKEKSEAPVYFVHVDKEIACSMSTEKYEPGVDHFSSNDPDRAEVKASTETPYGTLSVSWKRLGTAFSMDVHVPVNTKAVVQLPDNTVKEVESGTYHFETKLINQ